MHIALIGHGEDRDLERLQEELQADTHTCSRPSVGMDPYQIFVGLQPDVLLLDLSNEVMAPEAIAALVTEAHRDRYVPVLGLLALHQASAYDLSLGVDDFLVRPPRSAELVARVSQVQWRSRRITGEDAIRLGDLLIDLSRYEVRVAGREVTLTFKEYELLRLLAANPGRVFTREALLERIWGYDYFGGTRTVDVHIRRLRSKLEDPDHTFVETVRNVGYRLTAG